MTYINNANETRDIYLFIYLFISFLTMLLYAHRANAPEEQSVSVIPLETVAGAASMLSLAPRIIRACLFNRMSMNV